MKVYLVVGKAPYEGWAIPSRTLYPSLESAQKVADQRNERERQSMRDALTSGLSSEMSRFEYRRRLEEDDLFMRWEPEEFEIIE